MTSPATEVRQVGRNLSFTFVGKLILYGLSAGFTIYLAPALGDRDFGLYTIVRAFVALFALVPDMGIGLVVIRDVAADHGRARAYLLNSLLAKLALAALAFAALVPLGTLIYPAIPARLFVLAGLGLLAQAVGMLPVQGLQAMEQMGAAAALELTSHLVFIAGGFWAVSIGAGVEGVMGALAASGMVALVAGGVVMVVRFRPTLRDANWRDARYLLREGFPLGLGAALGLIYLQADKLILGRLLGEAPVAWYNVAYVLYYTLIEVVNTPVVVGSYPTLSRYYKNDPAALDKLLEKLVYGMIVLGLPLAVGGTLMAGPLIGFLYGDAYPQSPPVLAGLLWSLVLIFPGNILAQMLIVEGRQDRIVLLRVVSAMLAVALNAVMVAVLGHVGPAVAIFLVQVIVNAIIVWWMRARLPALRVRKYLLRVMAAQVPMAVVCVVMERAVHWAVGTGRVWDLGVPLTILAAVYAVALVVVGAVRREDWRYVREAVGR